MKAMKKALAVGASSLVALSSVSGVALAATQDGARAEDAPAAREVAEASDETSIVRTDVVVGDFEFTQGHVNSLDEVAKHIGQAASYLCGAQASANDGQGNVKDWKVTLRGAVKEPVVMSLGELDEKAGAQKVVMGCSCAGNPVDGRASVNAVAKGISLSSIMEEVQLDESTNTVVFVSTDGYSVAVPLSYLRTVRGSLVFDVNGAPLCDSVGGTNQLWLGSTAASYFVRDVAEIVFECRQTPPPSPTSDEARTAFESLPNIGVLYGGEIR